jgi:aryl-alcohol dehydrogenase-like predicted oxidoreductase
MSTNLATPRRSRIVFGTFGLPDSPLATSLLDRYHEHGGRALDLAIVYRDGEAQQAAGKWLQQRGVADEMVIYAKGCHPPFCRPELVESEVERIRNAVGVDRIDVFLLHRDEPTLPVAAFAEALLAEVSAGRIAGFGVSNWTVERTRALKEHLDRSGSDHLVAFSNHFSLAEMVSAPWPGCLAVTTDELAELGEMSLKMLAWSSLATGYFAGGEPPSWASAANEGRRARARELAAERGATATAIALAYVLHQPDHVLPVVGTTSLAHLEEAVSAAEIELSADELAWLESAQGALA